VASLALHLLPGTVALAFCVVIEPLVVRAGWPLLMVVNLFAVCVIIPLELTLLFAAGKRRNRSLSLKGIVLNRQRPRVRDVLVLAPSLIVWSAFVFAVLSPPVEAFLKQNVFGWMPHWFFSLGTLGGPAGAHAGTGVSPVMRTMVLITAGAYLVINPLTASVEELYFRGYLLPRMPMGSGWAPAVNAVLFSLQHWFSPWQNPARILSLVPMVYAVAWKRNLFIGIAVHVVLDVLSGVILLVPLLR
jgi:membrane protease YdiL (CAAX protease family)